MQEGDFSMPRDRQSENDDAAEQGLAPDGARSLASSAPRPTGEAQGVGPPDGNLVAVRNSVDTASPLNHTGAIHVISQK